MQLTNNEKVVLLGILEDLVQEEDIIQQPIDFRATIVSIIHKLGGGYFGKLATDDEALIYARIENLKK